MNDEYTGAMPGSTEGYIVPDGRPLSRENYPALFAAVDAMQNAPSPIFLSEPEFIGRMPVRSDVEIPPLTPEQRRAYDESFRDIREAIALGLQGNVGQREDMASDDPLEDR